MLKIIEKLEGIGESIRANIRYDLPFVLDRFSFFILKNENGNFFKHKLNKSLNRQITADDKL